METDFKYEQKFKFEVLNSPIVIEKSFNFEESEKNKEIVSQSNNSLNKFSVKTCNRFKFSIEKKIEDEIVSIEDKADVEVNQVLNEFNSDNKDLKSAKKQQGKSIIKDLETLGSSSETILKKNSHTIKTKTNSKKDKNLVENSNIRPISDFFKNFEYSKASLKLSK